MDFSEIYNVKTKINGQKSNRHNSNHYFLSLTMHNKAKNSKILARSTSYAQIRIMSVSWLIVKHKFAWLHESFSSNVSFCLPISGVPWWISLFNDRYSIYITAIHKKRPQTILNDYHKKASHNLLMITCVKLTGIWSTNSVKSWDFCKTFPGPLS